MNDSIFDGGEGFVGIFYGGEGFICSEKSRFVTVCGYVLCTNVYLCAPSREKNSAAVNGILPRRK